MSANPTASNWRALQRAQRAIVVADVVESVRLIEQDELGVIDRWRRFVNEVVTEVLPTEGGRLVKSLGDGMMLEFADALCAVRASFEMQRRIGRYNVAPQSDIELRIGAHVADIVVDDLDVYGAGVNLAARLGTLARPGEIVVSADLRDHLVPALDADIEDLGECYVKHVAQPVRAYRLAPLDAPPRAPRPASADMLTPTLAVIPFRADSLGSEQAVVGDAIAGDLIGAFSRAHSLRVISELSARAFRDRPVDVGSASSALGADYLLTGSCVGHAERLHIRAQLVDTRSAEVVWADALDGKLDAILFGVSDVVQRILDAVAVEVVAHEVVRAAQRDVNNLESYTLLTGAIHLMHRLSPTQYARAHTLLEALIARMPKAATAYGWLAQWHVLRVQQGWAQDREAEARLALDATRRALDADPSCSIALVVDGFVHTNLLRRFDIAERRYAQALSINPNDSLAWLLKGTLHAFRGEGEQAVHDASRASALSPLDPLRYFYDSLGATANLSAERFEEAVVLASRSLKANRTHTSTLRALAIALVQLGRLDEARETVRELLRLEPQLTIRLYLERTPARDFPTGALWARSLADAGVPAG